MQRTHFDLFFGHLSKNHN